MSQQATAVEDYLALQRTQRWRGVRDEQATLVRKSYALQLARAASRIVKDRHKRAEIKAEFYGRVLPVLELHAREQARMRRLYQQVILGLACALTLVTTGAVLALL